MRKFWIEKPKGKQPGFAEFVPRAGGRAELPKERLHAGMIGKATMDFAARHPGSSVQAVKGIIEDIARIELVNVDSKIARKVYPAQTPEDIFQSRKIPTTFITYRISKETISYPAFGCNAMCNALIAVLKLKKIPSFFIRCLKSTKNGELATVKGKAHSVVLLQADGRQFIADPFEKRPEKRMTEFTPELRQRFAEMEKQGLLATGNDSWDLGIEGFKSMGGKKTSFFQKQ